MSSQNPSIAMRQNDLAISDLSSGAAVAAREFSSFSTEPLGRNVNKQLRQQQQQENKIKFNDNNEAASSSSSLHQSTQSGLSSVNSHQINPSLSTAAPTRSSRASDRQSTSSANLDIAVRDRRSNFKSLLASTSPVIDDNDASLTGLEARRKSPLSIDARRSDGNNSELIDLANFSGASNQQSAYCDTIPRVTRDKKFLNSVKADSVNIKRTFLSATIPEEDTQANLFSDDSDEHREKDNFLNVTQLGENEQSDGFADEEEDDDDDDDDDRDDVGPDYQCEPGGLSKSPSYHKLKAHNSAFIKRVFWRIQNFGSDLTDKIASVRGGGSSTIAYTAYEDAGTSTGRPSGLGRKYKRLAKQPRNLEQNFRGSYKYSRSGIMFTIIKKLLAFLFQRSTLALFGAFLIHVTLGTIYTLSNINSYMTSYMRKHGSPEATYGESMWISSSYAVGQGISMVLGGLIERRFSARLSCIIGCTLHSLSIMSTSKAIDYGQLAVFLTYGFLPGFGCGLAYMTPMSNGFGWYPHRKGLVAGVILAGFGIGTFVFNMAQTAFVNPNNLSPPKDAFGYFTQDEILDNVPNLFTFLGLIYATMQFIGCCLLFKPPKPHDLSGTGSRKSSVCSDERPILMDSEISFKKAIRSRQFIVLFLVFGITNQGVLFVNSMLKEYGQIFIADDLYLAWTGSMASIANSLGRLFWGMAIDRFSFTQCFTSITTIFGTLIFIMPYEFVLSSKLLYLLCTLGIFGSFSGWMSTYPVHLSRIFGVHNSGMIYGLIFVSQALGGIVTAFAAHYLIDQYSRFVPFFCVTFLEVLGLAIYHLFYEKPLD